jgi:REP element-mobilizing transposase RayT
MLLQSYQSEELTFAWCYRVYYRWRTRRRKPISVLPELTADTLGGLIRPYGIHLLELTADLIDVRALVSLAPNESVSVAAGKLKGRVSKWLSGQFARKQAAKPLARGYFAITSGHSTADEINAYLERQGEHHGYVDRVRPPVFVRTYAATSETESILRADHAVTRLRFHVVLATWRRRGVFAQASAAAISDRWQQPQADLRVRIDKVSFVPDHVHVALTLHPAVVPASVVAALMNAGQEIMWRQFERDVIQAGVERLWQPSAYVGSFGDLTSPAVSAYVSQWERDDGE